MIVPLRPLSPYVAAAHPRACPRPFGRRLRRAVVWMLLLGLVLGSVIESNLGAVMARRDLPARLRAAGLDR